MDALGLDIGGANLKAAHTGGQARSVPFALWKNPSGLTDALRNLLATMPSADTLAVTMTGELCDCFENKRQGVLAILDAVQTATKSETFRVWNNEGHLVDVTAARQSPLQIASANWLALATFAGRYASKGPALLIDIGSTTTDIVPLLDGRPVPNGRTDLERIRCWELRYTGVRRTPLCSLLAGYGAAEFFATTLDAYLLLDLLPEDPSDCNTADGRPATKAGAELRMARMLCSDLETSTRLDRLRLANLVFSNQKLLLGGSFVEVADRLDDDPKTVIYAGEGEFLIRLALKEQDEIPPCPAISLTLELGPDVSRAGCAYAVAMLAAESSG